MSFWSSQLVDRHRKIKTRYNVFNRKSDPKPRTVRPEVHSGILVRRPGVVFSVPGIIRSITEKRGILHLQPTKLLLNVTLERSLGPVQVVISPEKTVGDLVKCALEIYVKDKRRPVLKMTDPKNFELHYSQFSLESLNPNAKLIHLGSRNLFLCSKTIASSPHIKEAIATDFEAILAMFVNFLL